MPLKKTVAIIVSSNEKATTIVKMLSLEKYRLLLISKYPNQFIELSEKIKSNDSKIELEIINCMKDGCWEADIIILDILPEEEKEVADLIKEVATQKIVVSFSGNNNAFENEELKNLLKYSKVVKAFNLDSQEIVIKGKDPAALLEISNILTNSKQVKITNQSKLK